MKPKKEVIDKAKADGAIDRVNQLMASAYICLNVAEIMTDRSTDVLERYGLQLGKLKHDIKALMKLFQEVDSEFISLSDKGQVGNWASELDDFLNIVEKYHGIPRTWQPKDKVFRKPWTISLTEPD